MKKFLFDKGTVWLFTPPPSTLGVWERMIKTTWNILDSMLYEVSDKNLSHEVLIATFMCKCAVFSMRDLLLLLPPIQQTRSYLVHQHYLPKGQVRIYILSWTWIQWICATNNGVEKNFLPNVSGTAGSKSTCTLYNLEESGNMTKLTWTPVSLSCWKIPRNTETTGRLEWWKMLSVEKMITFEKQEWHVKRFIQDPWPNLFCFWVSTEIIKTPLTVTE